MKQPQILLPALAFVLSLLCFSCKEKKESTDIIIKKPVQEQVKKETQKMENSSSSTTVNWVGSIYTVDLLRTADSSLPTIDDGTGVRYFDNSVQVRIVRKDGSEFFNQTFTKKDFEAYLDKDYVGRCVLQAIVCLKAEDNHVVFSVSLGSPDVMSEEYVLLTMRISRMGDVSISKDSDTSTNDDEFIDDEEIVED